jgi:hypothetical protein
MAERVWLEIEVRLRDSGALLGVAAGLRGVVLAQLSL